MNVVLLDKQQIAFDIVLHEVEKARGGDHKSVVIVSGGPGSGKSVIALSLLGEPGRRGRTAVHARPDHEHVDVTLSGAISQRRLPARLAESTTRR